jgi:hypothetical protein
MDNRMDIEISKLTIAALIAAITCAALEVTEDEEQASTIAGLAVVKLLAASAPETMEYLLAACGAIPIH